MDRPELQEEVDPHAFAEVDSLHPFLFLHSIVQIDSCDSDSKPAEESDSGVELDEEEKPEEDVDESESRDNGDDGEGGGGIEGNDKNKRIIEDEGLSVGDTGDDSETDTEDFTDSEDDTVEYMDDGEPVRKCKRGFKILQNCKRFWKASYD